MNDRGNPPATSSSGAKESARLTRDCLDPWRYLEISAAGDIRPCCNSSALATLGGDGQIAAIRDNDGFRALRASLLSGDLQPACARCHIRKTVPTDALKRRLAKQPSAHADPYAPMRITELRIDINEKCNLRCDYCAVSSPDYRGVAMDTGLFAKVAQIVDEADRDTVINVNGHGETTYHPHWMEMCQTILDAGYRPQIISNLAKSYSDEEIALLARFHSIEVSLDSDDETLMKTIRKAVRPSHVFETIQHIRDTAARLKIRPAPQISLSVGIYAPAIWTLDSFIDRIVALGIRKLTFWNLVEMPHQTLVTPLRALDSADRSRARNILSAVRRKLEDADIDYIFAGDFDAMVEPLPKPLQLRATVRRAYRALKRRAFSAR
jgi:hypothetical protein